MENPAEGKVLAQEFRNDRVSDTDSRVRITNLGPYPQATRRHGAPRHLDSNEVVSPIPSLCRTDGAADKGTGSLGMAR